MSEPIKISPKNIQLFLDQDPNAEDKTVLYLKGNQLEVIPLSQTKLFDRVLAWFGFGPLSLKNISRFIQQNNILGLLRADQREAFAMKLIQKCEHYNQSHATQKVNSVFINNLFKRYKLQAADASSTVKGIKPNQVLDFACSSTDLGFSYIVDVNALPKENERNVWMLLLDDIRTNYENSIKNQRFGSINEASKWFKEVLSPLTNHPGDFNFSWVQKVDINGKMFLLTCQKGTPTVFIKHPDGKIERAHEEINPKLTFSQKPIDRLDVIVGISDGFGDYIPEVDMMAELRQVDTQANQIFNNLITRLVRGIPETDVPSASGSKTTKRIDKVNKGDNVALFVLR